MHLKRRIIPLLVFLLILIMACSLPEPSPAATATIPPSDTSIATTPPIITLTEVETLTDTPTPSLTPSPTPTETLSYTPTPSYSYIQGILWHDTCDFTGGEGGEPVVLGEGCVQWGEEPNEFGPNQVYDAYESGWEGVTLHIGVGACPSTGFGTAVTDASGFYGFYVLPPGVYCISYSPLTDGNDSILIPGGATYPQRGSLGLSRQVTVTEGENLTGINFGYAFQFYN